MKYHFLFCKDQINKNKVDEAYQREYEEANKFDGIHHTRTNEGVAATHLIDIFNPSTINLKNIPRHHGSEDAIYFGWMLKKDHYEKIYDRLNNLGYLLINDPDQYQSCHWFEGWYPYIKDLTAESLIIKRDEVRPMLDELLKFRDEKKTHLMIKDQVKSLKHNWIEACYLDKNYNVLEVTKVLSSFVKIKEEHDDFQGDLVVREFLDLKQQSPHPKSKMPRAEEYRSFVRYDRRKEKPFICTDSYWTDAEDYKWIGPDHNFIKEVAKRVHEGTGSNFFTVDTAYKTNGESVVIECGDGQVSAVPDHWSLEEFYSSILEM